MNRRLPILLALAAAFVTAGRAATPIRYDVTATVATTPASGGTSFGTKFFFQGGNRVAYRVIPAGETEADPALRWEYWSPATGGRAIGPAAGYAFVDVRGLGATGAVVGQSLTAAGDGHQEAALYWTADAGATVPSGFDPGYSLLGFVNAAERTAGETYSVTLAGPEKVSWDAAAPAEPPGAIPLPAGCDYGEIRGLSANGEVLLYVKDSASGVAHAAVWNGATCVTVGPAPDSGETFYGSSLAIDAVGNVALLAFVPGVTAHIYYVPAAARDTWQMFTFGPPDSSAYNLRIGGGAASFDTTTGGANLVNVALPGRAQQRTFAGYRSYLNAAGALIFGNEGKLKFWDAAAATGEPAEVPLSLTTASGGLDVAGYNDEGRVLVLSTLGNTRSLSILAPVFLGPTRVKVIPVRRNLKTPAGRALHQLLVKARVSGAPPAGPVRFVLKSRLPAGLRFRAADGTLLGAAKKPGRATLRIAATYRADGKTRTTAAAAVHLILTKPASRPTQ